ncbi:nitroreductase family protein [Mangrovicoccus ximenensis]|uniref:nitroreductase family protein n=1 Tax=Mangrovicoccus ximenensis TaxID=1911570 RepID=UPI002ED4F5C2
MPKTDDLAARLLAQRSSCRAFLPEPVRAEDLRQILSAARRAPSGANLQRDGSTPLPESRSARSAARSKRRPPARPRPPNTATSPNRCPRR